MFVKKAIKLKLSLEKTKQRRRCTSSVPEKDKVIVEGVNVVKTPKPSQAAPQGGIVEMEAPIHVSNVMVVDSTGVAGRVGYKEVDGKKSVFLKTGEVLDK